MRRYQANRAITSFLLFNAKKVASQCCWIIKAQANKNPRHQIKAHPSSGHRSGSEINVTHFQTGAVVRHTG